MKLVLLLTTFLSLSAFAKDFNLKCESSLNSSKLFEVNVTLPQGERNNLIAKSDNYHFFVTSAGMDVVELQVYDSSEPSRSYASASLTKAKSVELVIWKRESLLEARCTLVD